MESVKAECWNAACEWDSSAQGVGDCSCPDLGLYTDCDGQCFDDSISVGSGTATAMMVPMD